jgi:hypothetical protein
MLLIKHGRFKSIILINSFHGLIFLRGYFRFNLDGFIGDELRGLIDALIVRELSFALLRSNPDHLVGGHSSQVSV